MCSCGIGDANYAAERRERLLALYPPGTLTRTDVHARFKDRPPTNLLTRPTEGWPASEYPIAAARAVESERRTGKEVQTVERYLTADGLFSLCYIWFYYDTDDRLTDTEWQWSSD